MTYAGDIEPYLIPATRKLVEEIKTTSQFDVRLRKVYNSSENWQVNKESYNVIDMPDWDEGNKVSFTHELIHIYFFYCKGMRLTHLDLLFMPMAYSHFFPDKPWYLANHFVTLSNHLQHHKMVPYFKAYQFPMDQIIINYNSPEDLFQVLEENLDFEYDLEQAVHRYMAALSYVNFLCLELYFPNPAIRSQLVSNFSDRMNQKYLGLRALLEPILKSWDAEDFTDLRTLLQDINRIALNYAEGGSL